MKNGSLQLNEMSQLQQMPYPISQKLQVLLAES